jgi:hypothetical protein
VGTKSRLWSFKVNQHYLEDKRERKGRKERRKKGREGGRQGKENEKICFSLRTLLLTTIRSTSKSPFKRQIIISFRENSNTGEDVSGDI